MWSFSRLGPPRYGRLTVLIMAFLLACVATSAYAENAGAENIEIGDDVYEILLRLEAVGAIKSGLLTTRPISRAEAGRLIREAERAGLNPFRQDAQRPFEKTLIEGLKKN